MLGFYVHITEENAMHTKVQTTHNTRRHIVLRVVNFLIFYIIIEYVFFIIYGSDGFGEIKRLICVVLFSCLLDTVKKTWNSYFSATVYGKVMLISDSMSNIPLKNVEISWGPYHHRKKYNTPVITNAKGEFHFDDLPLKPNLTLTAKLPNKRYVHNVIGEIEDIRWLLGSPWLELPISSGTPKRVDFIVPSEA